jgi:predicted DNA-binding ribbon-helix-helix protein
MPRPPRGRSVPVRSVRLDGHGTCVSVEDAFWTALKAIAAAQGTSIDQLVTTIDHERRKGHHFNLSSAIRLLVLDYYRSRMSP